MGHISTARNHGYAGLFIACFFAFSSSAQIHIRGEHPEMIFLPLYEMTMPVDGVVVSGHGWRGGRVHHGLDITQCNYDTAVSAWDGVVRYARNGWNGGYGNLVIVLHSNGLETYYAHFRELLVVEGQTVQQNDPVGIVGSTGNSLGAHLHYEVRYHGLSIDPETIHQNPVLWLEKEGNHYIVK